MAYAYKKLLSAEKLARQRGVFSDSLLSFDYDFDGKKEYLSQTTLHNMYLHTLGGRIFECAVFSAGKNFCRFSGDAEKASAEGLFIDYFLSKEEAAKTLSLPSCPLPNVFASTYYQEDFVDAARREVGLKASGLYGRFGQPVSLKKRFFFAKSGLQVQFILKNDSPMNLSGVFATALHFALSPHKKRPAEVSVFSCEERLVSVEGATEYPQAEWILISDADGGAEFKIDANENPSAIVRLSCQKGEGEGSKSAFGPSLTVFLCWQAELSPGYETEKTVFLTVMP